MLACAPASMSLCRATAWAAISTWSASAPVTIRILPYGIVGIGAHGHGGRADAGQIQARRADLPAFSAMTIDIALRNGADVNRETHRPVLRDHAEVAGDHARGLNRLIGWRGPAKTIGMLSG